MCTAVVQLLIRIAQCLTSPAAFKCQFITACRVYAGAAAFSLNTEYTFLSSPPSQVITPAPPARGRGAGWGTGQYLHRVLTARCLKGEVMNSSRFLEAVLPALWTGG